MEVGALKTLVTSEVESGIDFEGRDVSSLLRSGFNLVNHLPDQNHL